MVRFPNPKLTSPAPTASTATDPASVPDTIAPKLKSPMSSAGHAHKERPPTIAKFTPRALNWVPDLPDYRDRKLVIPNAQDNLPKAVDLRTHMSPVEDQGQIGSCTGNAIVGAMEYLRRKAHGDVTDLSRLFVYYNERLIEHTTRKDAGAYIRDGIKSVAKEGVAPESLWPYDEKKYARRPVKAAYEKAKEFVISEYLRIDTFPEFLRCLADGFPVVFGFTVYSSFMSNEVARSGVMPLPRAADTVEGGHAILAVGYDMSRQLVLIRNSWGRWWGQAGYFWMPFAYASNPDLCDDFWTVRAFKPNGT